MLFTNLAVASKSNLLSLLIKGYIPAVNKTFCPVSALRLQFIRRFHGADLDAGLTLKA
jgi:hypothetical protein